LIDRWSCIVKFLHRRSSFASVFTSYCVRVVGCRSEARLLGRRRRHAGFNVFAGTDTPAGYKETISHFFIFYFSLCSDLLSISYDSSKYLVLPKRNGMTALLVVRRMWGIHF
jgi:hypothetical protein